MNPASGDIDEALKATRNQLRAKVAVAREGKTQLEALIDRARSVPPPGLELPQAAALPSHRSAANGVGKLGLAGPSASTAPGTSWAGWRPN